MKEQLSNLQPSVEALAQKSYAITRVLQEGKWDKSSLGDEIRGFIIETRNYKKGLEEEKF